MAFPDSRSPFRPDCLNDTVALVTGGATGIGFGICVQLGAHGARIAICGRRQDKLTEAVDQLRALSIQAVGFQCDVRDFEKCKALTAQVFNHYGRIDFLVNNAAGNFAASIEDLTPNGLSTVLGIDLQGTFNMCKASLEYLKSSPAPCIVNITATLHYKGLPFQFHAASAKAGVDVLTRTLGVEWAEYGIRVVGVAPGPIAETTGGPGGRVFGSMGVDQEKPELDRIRDVVPAGRFGSVQDIGLAVVYLCGPAATFVTSETLVVDGGQWHGTSNIYHQAKKIVKAKSSFDKKSRAKL